MPTCRSCQQSFPVKAVIQGKTRNLQRRTNCLVCLPFGADEGKSRKGPERNCVVCDRPAGSRRRRCNSCNTKIRRLRWKLRAIEHLGGACVKCGWDEHPAGLQFHHRDPEAKDFTMGNVANKSWGSIKAELDKCDLLCACCHCIEHSDRFDNPRLLAEARRYHAKVAQLSGRAPH